ncbi:MAG: hypothetical protein JW705_08990 [Methanosarcinaceae archaeon]|nr:hypothetical protein [Methanosarcinaceae archaeon]
MVEKYRVADIISSIFSRCSGREEPEEGTGRLASHLVEPGVDIRTHRAKLDKSVSGEKVGYL